MLNFNSPWTSEWSDRIGWLLCFLCGLLFSSFELSAPFIQLKNTSMCKKHRKRHHDLEENNKNNILSMEKSEYIMWKFCWTALIALKMNINDLYKLLHSTCKHCLQKTCKHCFKFISSTKPLMKNDNVCTKLFSVIIVHHGTAYPMSIFQITTADPNTSQHLLPTWNL